jgi:hypothetical protein
LAVFAAGFAGGLAYWVIAGWNAGFWKPLFGPEKQLSPVSASSPPQIR